MTAVDTHIVYRWIKEELGSVAADKFECHLDCSVVHTFDTTEVDALRAEVERLRGGLWKLVGSNPKQCAGVNPLDIAALLGAEPEGGGE